jgi:hypothetical protein
MRRVKSRCGDVQQSGRCIARIISSDMQLRALTDAARKTRVELYRVTTAMAVTGPVLAPSVGPSHVFSMTPR